MKRLQDPAAAGRAEDKAGRPSSFQYYLHDAVESFRIEMAGELTHAGLVDLVGCFRTAEATIRGRRVVLDVRRLKSVDAAGQAWFDERVAAGALYAIRYHRQKGFQLSEKWLPAEPKPRKTPKSTGRFRRWFLSPLASTVAEDDSDPDVPWLDCRS